jgi:LmbE family N-acetylglucosaminyl deacetylase
MPKPRLLISYAHPDDESFGHGGLIAKYIAQGYEVYLICATDGDLGSIPEDMQGQYKTVRELRLAELDAANEILKFTKIFRLAYTDSGMMGAESTNNPNCLWYQWNHDPASVIRRVVEVIREVKPHVVLTFNRYGGYGHPDHIAIQRATTEAFKLAGDSRYLTYDQPVYQAPKLYYSSMHRGLFQYRLLRMRLSGQDPRKMGRNQDIDMLKIIENFEPAHAIVDVGDYLEIWDQAAACHKSQGGGSNAFFRKYPMWLRRLVQGKQLFTRVFPEPQAERIDEQDLFEGIIIDIDESVVEYA